jgi:hypothetical protein
VAEEWDFLPLRNGENLDAHAFQNARLPSFAAVIARLYVPSSLVPGKVVLPILVRASSGRPPAHLPDSVQFSSMYGRGCGTT